MPIYNQGLIAKEVKETVITQIESSALPLITELEKSTILSTGKLNDKDVENGALFAIENGSIEQFSKTPVVGDNTSYTYAFTKKSYDKNDIDLALNNKQGTLTAGTNITIDENNVISASGREPEYDDETQTIIL